MQTPTQLLKLILRAKVTVLLASTGMHQHLIDIAQREGINFKKSSLRFVIIGSEKITPIIHSEIEKFYGVPCHELMGDMQFTMIGYGCPLRGNNVAYHHILYICFLSVYKSQILIFYLF